jgi:hypothetical protein
MPNVQEMVTAVVHVLLQREAFHVQSVTATSIRIGRSPPNSTFPRTLRPHSLSAKGFLSSKACHTAISKSKLSQHRPHPLHTPSGPCPNRTTAQSTTQQAPTHAVPHIHLHVPSPADHLISARLYSRVPEPALLLVVFQRVVALHPAGLVPGLEFTCGTWKTDGVRAFPRHLQIRGYDPWRGVPPAYPLAL